MGEHKFPDTVVGEIAKKAMLICSNPHCLRLTGYSTTEGKPRAIAEAAHVLPSGKSGPRHESIVNYPELDLSSAENGIWLCLGCHKKVDDDPRLYAPDMLFGWKKKHEGIVRGLVGLDLEAALLELRDAKRYHQETKDLLSYFDNKRALYEELDSEFPPRVLDSIEMMRTRITETRSRVSADSEVFIALGRMQDAINAFLRNIGPKTDLRKLRCNGGDPVWLRFSEELMKFRAEMIVIIEYLAEGCSYQMTHVGR
jgi:hypothetical protein